MQDHFPSTKKIMVPSTLKDIIDNDLLFIDKTIPIMKLVQLSHTFKFIGRPAHFGKSITLDILEHLFSGHQAIFQKLNAKCCLIWNFSKKYCVLRLNLRFTIESEQSFLESVRCYFISIAQSLIGSPRCTSKWDQILMEILNKKTSNGQRIVILIDNFDYCLYTLPEGISNRPFVNFLSELVTICAKYESSIEFFLCLGLSYQKFQNGRSNLQNYAKNCLLYNYSHNSKVADVFGFTKDEINTGMATRLESISLLSTPFKTFRDREDVLNYIEYYYGGYRFSPNSPITVINPYTVLRIFDSFKVDDYWLKAITQHDFLDTSPHILSNFIDKINPHCDLSDLPSDIIKIYKGEALPYECLTKYQFLIDYGFFTFGLLRNEETISIPNISIFEYLLNIIISKLSETCSLSVLENPPPLIGKCAHTEVLKDLQMLIMKSASPQFPSKTTTICEMWQFKLFALLAALGYSIVIKIPHSNEYLLGICESLKFIIYLFVSFSNESSPRKLIQLIHQHKPMMDDSLRPQDRICCLISSKMIEDTLKFDVVLNSNSKCDAFIQLLQLIQSPDSDPSSVDPNAIGEMNVIVRQDQFKRPISNNLVSFIDVVMQSIVELDSKAKRVTVAKGVGFSAEQITEFMERLFPNKIPNAKMLAQVKLSLQYLFETNKITRMIDGQNYFYGIKKLI